MWGLRRTYNHTNDKDAAMAPADDRTEDVERPLLDGQDAGKAIASVARERSPSLGGASKRRILGLPVVLVAGLCYCGASGAMVLLNKHALASFGFTAPCSLLCFQCVLAVVLVKLCQLAGWVTLQPLKTDLVMVWVPVNVIFVGMLGTGFYALRDVGEAEQVPMALQLP